MRPRLENKSRMTNFSPVQNLKGICNYVEHLEEFLIDTSQLLISSISVQDSNLSIEQAR